MSDNDLLVSVLNGLNPDFSQSTALNTRKTFFTYEDMFNKLTNFESKLKQQKAIFFLPNRSILLKDDDQVIITNRETTIISSNIVTTGLMEAQIIHPEVIIPTIKG